MRRALRLYPELRANKTPFLDCNILSLLTRASNLYVEISGMVIVFEEHYVRALLINVENELTKIVGLPFVDGKFAASVLTVHDYSNVVTKGRRWIITGAIKWGDANFAFAQLRRLITHTPWPPP
jgi:hypothetical protein